MIIECNEAGVAILRQTSATIDNAAETIIYDTDKNLLRCDEYREELGPHVDDLEGALEYIKLTLNTSTEAVKMLVLKLNSLAVSYEDIISLNPFADVQTKTK